MMIRRLSLLLLGVALFLVLWVLYLGATLRGQAMVRMWSETWVGLDCLEICGLIATAGLVIGRRSGVVVAAAMTGTLFLVDAWFDVMLSEGGVGEVLSALFGELPCAAVCFAIALTAPEWVRDHDRAAALAARRLARLRRLQRRLLSMRD